MTRSIFTLANVLFWLSGLARTVSAADDPLRLIHMEADQADFYVAPDGNDDNPGTRDKPFQSLSGARNAVLQLKRQPREPGVIVVMLRGGTYHPSQSVVFSDRDSGTKESPIVYMSYPGERPVLSGGRTVTDWKVHQGKIIATVLPKEENQYYRFRTMFFDGRRQIRARYPNFDPQHPWNGGWAFIQATVPADASTPVTLQWEPDVFGRAWSRPEHGEIFIIPGAAWNSHFIPIAASDHANRTLTVTRRLTQRWEKLQKGNRFRVENLLEELDQPGEWCFDPDSTTLYFWPPEGNLQGAEVTVPVLDRLIELRSTGGRPVQHLKFFGLSFTQTMTVFPNPIPKHPDYVDCNQPNSAGYSFYMENTQHCVVENCRFDQVGGDAIRLHGYSAYNRIVGNEIVEAGAQGICLADLNFWPYDFPPIWRGNAQRLRSMSSRLPWAIGNVISENHIHHSGLTDNFGAAIHFHGMNCQDNEISHNLIHHMPHHAIYFSMGFGRNTIEYNDLHTLCLVMADAGGVYCNRWCILEDDDTLQNNNIIRFNRIIDVRGVAPVVGSVEDPANTPSHDRIHTPHFTWGIYFDNSPQRAEIYGNLTVGNVWGGVFLGGGYGEPADCVIENNVFVESSVYQFDLFMHEPASHGNRFVRNVVYYKNESASLLRARTPEEEGAKAVGIQECDFNVYFSANGKPLKLVGVPDESWDAWRKMGFDTHSVVADPLFVDPENGDYRLRQDSPALKLGFQPIPFEKIGLRHNQD